MTPDSKLLADFARTRSEAAFAELVRRHVNLVYSAALRQVHGDTHLAEDVAQTVFTDLARKAVSLARRESLSGWLYTSAHFAATKVVRTETRRRDREEHFMREPIHEPAPAAEWEQLRPALDDAMHELKEGDREAVLLRYFENRPYAEVGAKLGLNENAARMRIERALEKLRAALARKGITATATLASVLSSQAVQIAPVSLATTLTATALASAGTGAVTFLKIMTATQMKIGFGALVVAGMTTALVVQQHMQAKLRSENDLLRRQLAQVKARDASLARHFAQMRPGPRLPAPLVQIAPPTNASPTEDSSFTNLFSRFTNAPPKLTAAQIAAYLKANRTNAASMLAAYRTGGDSALLKEAMEKYPHDPQVAFEAVVNKDFKDMPAEDQRRWLNAFEQSAPDNALANYLSALNYLNAGQIDQGIQELTDASGKGVNDYTLARDQADEEAYLAAGYSPAEAERIADSWLMIPQDSQVKQLGVDLVDVAKAYTQSGDHASAQAAFQMAVNLGQSYSATANDPILLNQLVGLAIQKTALSAMDPNTPVGDGGLTAQDEIAQINQTRAAIRELGDAATPWLPTLSDEDMLNYENRRRAFGEVAALQWVVGKFGQP